MYGVKTLSTKMCIMCVYQWRVQAGFRGFAMLIRLQLELGFHSQTVASYLKIAQTRIITKSLIRVAFHRGPPLPEILTMINLLLYPINKAQRPEDTNDREESCGCRDTCTRLCVNALQQFYQLQRVGLASRLTLSLPLNSHLCCSMPVSVINDACL